jgi:hypothetical protein
MSNNKMEDKHEYNSPSNVNHNNSQTNNNNNETGSEVTTKMVEWSQENEMILVEWCDIAQCYKWMNTRAHSKYSTLNALYTIPTIVLSTITGTASFAQSSLPVNQQKYTPMIIGTVNIFIGIINTVHQYLKIAELNESHRVSAISWDKYARNIRIELAKAPGERMDAGHFLKLNRQEYDRLMETSPAIPQEIVDEFMKSFRGKDGSKERERFDELKKPDICNIIISANEYRHHWYKNAPSHSVKIQSPSQYNPSEISLSDISSTLFIKDELLKEKDKLLNEKDKELKKEKIINTIKKVGLDALTAYKPEALKMDKYVADFKSHYGRIPLAEEISENFHEEIAKEHIASYLSKYSKMESNVSADSAV